MTLKRASLLLLLSIICNFLTAQEVMWTELVGTVANGNVLTKTASNGWSNGGAISAEVISNGNGGYVEYSLQGKGSSSMFGLNDVNGSTHYGELDYAWYVFWGDLYILENGNHVANGSAVDATIVDSNTDKLRIEVTSSGNVNYYHNGTLIYTSAVSVSANLFADCSIYYTDMLIVGDISESGTEVGVKYSNRETSEYGASMKSPDFTYLLWDRNDEGDGNFSSAARPMFFYWDNDDGVLGYLIDTRNMELLNARFHSADIVNNLNTGGDLITDQLNFSSSAGLDIDLGSAGGDFSIYDAGETKYILGDQDSGEPNGIVLRTTVNPSAGNSLFAVESSGNSQRLRVEHYGALSTSNYLEVNGTGPSFIKGKLAVNGYQFPVDTNFP